MQSWLGPVNPKLPGMGRDLRLFDSATQSIRPTAPGKTAKIYVCGITPYDATHMGHAATYLAFDLINRYLQLTGRRVEFVENITDIDDPLFERAKRDNQSWRDLGESQVSRTRFGSCASHLRTPDHLNK